VFTSFLDTADIFDICLNEVLILSEPFWCSSLAASLVADVHSSAAGLILLLCYILMFAF